MDSRCLACNAIPMRINSTLQMRNNYTASYSYMRLYGSGKINIDIFSLNFALTSLFCPLFIPFSQ